MGTDLHLEAFVTLLVPPGRRADLIPQFFDVIDELLEMSGKLNPSIERFEEIGFIQEEPMIIVKVNTLPKAVTNKRERAKSNFLKKQHIRFSANLQLDLTKMFTEEGTEEISLVVCQGLIDG